MQSFVKDLFFDEVREGFFVTSHRKRLWNVQIQLMLEVDRICRKHNLKWFMHSGTLLGAARHKGFIPWDDDVDIAMLRPDYERFMRVAPSELPAQYFLDDWCNYRLEEETFSDVDQNLPLVSQNITNSIRRKNWYWPLRAGYSKLRDSTTTMIQWTSRRNVNQGIWIDIFPIDPVPPFDDPQREINFMVAQELRLAASNLPKFLANIDAKKQSLIPPEPLKKLIAMPFKARARAYERHMLATFFESKYASTMAFYRPGREYPMKTVLTQTELSFEQVSLPAPSGYDELLRTLYGDWHKIVFAKGHVKIWSDSLPYTEYYARVKR